MLEQPAEAPTPSLRRPPHHGSPRSATQPGEPEAADDDHQARPRSSGSTIRRHVDPESSKRGTFRRRRPCSTLAQVKAGRCEPTGGLSECWGYSTCHELKIPLVRRRADRHRSRLFRYRTSRQLKHDSVWRGEADGTKMADCQPRAVLFGPSCSLSDTGRPSTPKFGRIRFIGDRNA